MVQVSERANVRNAFKQATPVARRVAITKMEGGVPFADIEDEFFNIVAIERKIYDGIKNELVIHIRRHGLDANALQYFDLFVAVKSFDKNVYNRILQRVRRSYSSTEKKIVKLEKDIFLKSIAKNYDVRFLEEEQEILKRQLGNLQYLIAKMNEYLKKVDDFAKEAFTMVMAGKQPDLDYWSSQVVIQNNLFEEHKQFLKQTLHHLETLRDNKCYLGIDAIKILLYHKQGCRRQKLYRCVEEWIIRIYYDLRTEDERRAIYKDICEFVQEIVPIAGYISPCIIGFVFDRGFLSDYSRDMLIKIQPIVTEMNMQTVITSPLREFTDKALMHLREGAFNSSDNNALEVYQCYHSKPLPQSVLSAWEEWKAKQQ